MLEGAKKNKIKLIIIIIIIQLIIIIIIIIKIIIIITIIIIIIITTKYTDLLKTHHFVPIAIETGGAWNELALEFITELGRKISRANH